MEPAVPPNKVFCFCVPAPTDGPFFSRNDVIAVACDEEGKTLSQHYCSNETFARGDIVRAPHLATYAKRYPAGYVTEWVGQPPLNWDGRNPKAPPAGFNAEELDRDNPHLQ